MFGENILNKKKLVINEGDYQKDGLWYCGKCNTQKEVITFGKKWACLCKCEAEERIQKEKKSVLQDFVKINQRGIDQEFRALYFKDSFPNQKEYVDKLKKFVEQFDTGYNFKKKNVGLYIEGKVGNGKTMLAKMLANEMLNAGHTVIMTSIQTAVDKINDFDTKAEYKKKLESCELLIIDDLGAETQNDYTKSKVAEIINIRYQIHLPIVVTTNLERSRLASTKDNKLPLELERSYSRLIECTYQMIVKENGYRIKIAEERKKELTKLFN